MSRPNEDERTSSYYIHLENQLRSLGLIRTIRNVDDAAFALFFFEQLNRDSQSIEVLQPDTDEETMSRFNEQFPSIPYVEGNPSTCAICHDEICKDESVKQIQCMHVFHGLCIQEWFQRARRCPLCRNEIILN